MLGVGAGVQLAVLPRGLVPPMLHSAATLLSLSAGGEDVLVEDLVCTRKKQPLLVNSAVVILKADFPPICSFGDAIICIVSNNSNVLNKKMDADQTLHGSQV